MTATTNAVSNASGVVNLATGQIVNDASAAAAVPVALGFQPRVIKLIQVNGAGVPITYEWQEGMANGTCLQSVAAGTQTINTSNGPTLSDKTMTFPAAVMLASTSFVWQAWG